MSDNNVDINPRLNIIDIPSSTSYWFVRANSQAQYYTDFQLNNYVATDSNGLSVKPLLEIPSTIRASEDALIESYKSVFQTHDLAKFDESVKQSKLTPAELKKARTKALTRSSNRAKKAFNFIENMNIGDFVIVPYKSSGYFLIGVVVSDVFDHPIEHIEMLDEEGENEYDVSPFTLKRSVLWIKELPRDKFPDKLSWIKTAHQSIFDITGYANDLNPYISPIYRYKKKVYCRIGVNTTDSISASDWLDYQIALRDIVQDNLNNVYQKQKVQSPGDIILYVEQNFWWLLPLILGCLFGDVSFTHGDFKVNFQGVFRYFSKGERLKRQLYAKSVQADFDNKQADINQRDAQTIKTITETNTDQESTNLATAANKNILRTIAARTSVNKDRVENNFSEESKSKKIEPPASAGELNTQAIQDKFKLSNENPGTQFPYETQEDNLIPDSEQSEEAIATIQKGPDTDKE